MATPDAKMYAMLRGQPAALHGFTTDRGSHILVAEATKKSDLVWLAAPGLPATAAWHIWQDGAAYVVTGPGEQPLPGIAGTPTCAVTVRSADKLGRIVTWEAAVTRVLPDSDEWAAVAPVLLAKRLSLHDAAGAAQRWAAECAVLRLAPTGRLLEAGESLPSDSGAAPPRLTPATTAVPVPFTIGRRRLLPPRRRSRQ
ncbi:MAG: hypothetical protein M3042_08860 [Actinomycetota bacterium]|nr:hypothetical protein [Actinomycetota bacterium]